jgi:hypothetical protein
MGEVDLEIVALAKELGVGLIVMGCRGHRGVRRAIEGSISDAVIRHTPCPVLVVRSHESAEVSRRLPSCKEEEVDKRPDGDQPRPLGHHPYPRRSQSSFSDVVRAGLEPGPAYRLSSLGA